MSTTEGQTTPIGNMASQAKCGIDRLAMYCQDTESRLSNTATQRDALLAAAKAGLPYVKEFVDQESRQFRNQTVDRLNHEVVAKLEAAIAAAEPGEET